MNKRVSPQETRRVACQLKFWKSKWQASLSFGSWPVKKEVMSLIFWLTLRHGNWIDGGNAAILASASASVCMAEKKKLQVQPLASWGRGKESAFGLEEERLDNHIWFRHCCPCGSLTGTSISVVGLPCSSFCSKWQWQIHVQFTC